jgi:hypothetical protein
MTLNHQLEKHEEMPSKQHIEFRDVGCEWFSNGCGVQRAKCRSVPSGHFPDHYRQELSKGKSVIWES